MLLDLNGAQIPLAHLTVIRQVDEVIQLAATVSRQAIDTDALIRALRPPTDGMLVLEGQALMPVRHLVPFDPQTMRLAALADWPLGTARRPRGRHTWRLAALANVVPPRQERQRRHWDQGSLADVIDQLLPGALSDAVRKPLASVKLDPQHPVLQAGVDREMAGHLLRQAWEAGLVNYIPAITGTPSGPVIELGPEESVNEAPREVILAGLNGETKLAWSAEVADLPGGFRIVIESRHYSPALARQWLARTPPLWVPGERGVITTVVDHFHIEEEVEWTTELVYGDAPQELEFPSAEVRGLGVIAADESQDPWCRLRLDSYFGQPEIWTQKTGSDPAFYPQLAAKGSVEFFWSGTVGDVIRLGLCDLGRAPFPVPCRDDRGLTLHKTAVKEEVHGLCELRADVVSIEGARRAQMRGSSTGVTFTDQCEMELP